VKVRQVKAFETMLADIGDLWPTPQ